MRYLFLMIAAAAVAFAIDFLIGSAGLRWAGVPKDFPPFTSLPILSGAVGGAVFGGVSYLLLRAVAAQPERAFLFLAIGFLAISFALPIRLSFTKSVRFAGVTPAAQMLLVLMHTVVATVTVSTLLSRPDR